MSVHPKVLTAAADFAAVSRALEAAGLPVRAESTGLVFSPLAVVDVDEAVLEANEALLERLLDVDDVDSVFTNCAGLQR